MKQIIHSFFYMVVPFGLLVLYRRRSRPVGSLSLPQRMEMLLAQTFVCVVCEDIGPWLHCFGDSVAVTPTIDALAAEGIRYTSIYGTVGVSAPFACGTYYGNVSHAYQCQLYAYAGGQIARPPAVTGYDIVLPEGIKCYTELLRAAGYYCTNNPKPTISFYRL